MGKINIIKIGRSDILNRLAKEKSPYLLQHKDNPVGWYPWGDEALEKAKTENKPIFLSIGYSTCRWCHNMNRESFQDEKIGEILNKYYIPIKVDREERPDLDKVYMTFAEAMTGSAGWPLNLILTPEKKPFFAGTYFPKESRNRMIGLIDLLNQIKAVWEEDQDRIIGESNRILAEVDRIYNSKNKGKLDQDILLKTKNQLKDIFDKNHGGFSYRPKFPLPQYIIFLLEYSQIAKDENAMEMAKFTLDHIYKGGLFDHIGFGFYRYSVDEKWLAPHFEKMLYDNGMLGLAYTLAFEKTANPLYKKIAEKTFEFVIRDLTSEEGGFYSALDAETEGEEGKFYLFTKEEIIEALGEEYGELYCDYYDISEDGNFEGKSIPNLIEKDLNSINDVDKAKLEGLRDKIFYYREKRIKPHRDEKILTSWNGLMIGALAYGGKVFSNETYINNAKRAADFIIANSIDKDGNLLSIHIGDESYNYGFLEDYAFFIFGLLKLYQATEDQVYLCIAKKLNEDMFKLFQDTDTGGLYFYSNISEELILKPKDIYDGAIPSGNGIALLNLSTLYKLNKDEDLYNRYKSMVETFAGDMNRNPVAHIYSILSLMG